MLIFAEQFYLIYYNEMNKSVGESSFGITYVQRNFQQ